MCKNFPDKKSVTVSYAKPNTCVNIAHMGRGRSGGAQWFIRWVDAEVDLFWESGQNFLFNLSTHTGFYTISVSISYNDSDNNRYARDMPKICPRYAPDMPKICPRYA